MNKTKAIHYLLYCIFIVAVFIFLHSILKSYELRQMRDFNIFNVHIAWAIAGTFLGVLMASEYIIKEWKKSGSWKVKIEKLLFFVLPFFFILFNVFFPRPISLLRFEGIGDITLKLSNMLTLAAVFLGYSLVTSFFKEVSIKTTSKEESINKADVID